jgi:hypothetical protein
MLLNKSTVAISDGIIGRDFKAKRADNQRFDPGFELAAQVRTTACANLAVRVVLRYVPS